MSARRGARWLVCAALAGVAAFAPAEPPAQIGAITLEPAAPVSGEPFAARVEAQGCLQLPGTARVEIDGARVRVDLDLTDTCDPALVVPSRSYPLPGLPPGPHTLAFHVCSGNAPPGAEACTRMRDIDVVVGFAVQPQGEQAAVEIPALRNGALVGLALGLALAGILALRR